MKIKRVLLIAITILVTLALILLVRYVNNNGGGITQVRVTNITSNSATVSWQTDIPVASEVVYSQDNSWPVLGNNGKTYSFDDNDYFQDKDGNYKLNEGGAKLRRTHHVTLRNLEPETAYYFRVNVDGKFFAGEITSLTTFKVAERVDIPDPIYGKVESSQNVPVSEGVLYYRIYLPAEDYELRSSAWYSSRINSSGGWTGDLGNIYDSSGNLYLKDSTRDKVDIEVFSESGAVKVKFPLVNYKPVPNIQLTDNTTSDSKYRYASPAYDYDLISKVSACGVWSVVCNNNESFTNGDCGSQASFNSVYGGNGENGWKDEACKPRGGIKTGGTSNPAPNNPPQNSCLDSGCSRGEGQYWIGNSGYCRICKNSCTQAVPDTSISQCCDLLGRGDSRRSQNGCPADSQQTSKPPVQENQIVQKRTTQDGLSCNPDDNIIECVSGTCCRCGDGSGGNLCKSATATSCDAYCAERKTSKPPVASGNCAAGFTSNYGATVSCDVKVITGPRHSYGDQYLQYVNSLNQTFTLQAYINGSINCLQESNQTEVKAFCERTKIESEPKCMAGYKPYTGTEAVCAETKVVPGIPHERGNLYLNYINSSHEQLALKLYSEKGLNCVEDKSVDEIKGFCAKVVSAVQCDPGSSQVSSISCPGFAGCSSPELIKVDDASTTTDACVYTNSVGTSVYVNFVVKSGIICKSNYVRNSNLAGFCAVANQGQDSGVINIPVNYPETLQTSIKRVLDSILSALLPQKVLAQSKSKLDKGQYTVSVNGESIRIGINNDNVEIRFFDDLNRDGIKQDNEPEVEENNLNISITKDPVGINYKLVEGWNLIALSIVSNDFKTAKDFINLSKSRGIPITHVSIYRNNQWKTFSMRETEDGKQNEYGDNFDLIPGEGIFIKTVVAGNLSLSGQEFTESLPISLNKGWNLIAVQSKTDYSAASFIDRCIESKIACNTLSVFESGRYVSLIKENGQSYGSDFKLNRKSGYFVRVTEGQSQRFTP